VSREQATKAGVTARFEQADIQQMPFADRQFDVVLCFRLYHHFPQDHLRLRVIRELCRLSRRYVLMSYLDPYAYTSLRRRILRGLGIKTSRQHATSLKSIRERFDRHHFRLLADIPRRRFLHTLHLAVFERI
ncbi:MAG: class I SAM-dependent methyltransferase, partial [Acidiferrobacterales bacterium]|nr:class I SAM-dependent methyltransferase [Acidiferrobacterales bacterium]